MIANKIPVCCFIATLFFANTLHGQSMKFEYTTKTQVYSLTLTEKQDSLVGSQCFTYGSGNKIDCCTDEPSIRLAKTKEHFYVGTMKSCYDDKPHPILINMQGKTLLFYFNDNSHVFLEQGKAIQFKKAKK